MAILSAAMALAAVTSPISATPFGEQRPVNDAALAAVRGTAAPTTRLSTLVAEQGATQGQLVGETLRGIFDNWFADTSVQLIANQALLRP